jgi:hypothetical protein
MEEVGRRSVALEETLVGFVLVEMCSLLEDFRDMLACSHSGLLDPKSGRR